MSCIECAICPDHKIEYRRCGCEVHPDSEIDALRARLEKCHKALVFQGCALEEAIALLAKWGKG